MRLKGFSWEYYRATGVHDTVWRFVDVWQFVRYWVNGIHSSMARL